MVLRTTACTPSNQQSWYGDCGEVEWTLQGDFMATSPIERSGHNTVQAGELLSYEEAIEKLSREERFRATVYAMNTLLVQKGIYSPEEFELQFRQFAKKTLR